MEPRGAVRTGGAIGHPEVAMLPKMLEFLQDQTAAITVEYGIIAAGITVAIIAA